MQIHSDLQTLGDFSLSTERTEDLQMQVLVLASADDLETMEICRRLREVGVEACIARDFANALDLLDESCEPTGAILIPSQFHANEIAEPISRLLARALPQRPQLISFGAAPKWRERRKLRKIGFRLALWSPLCEARVRTQINRAFNPDRETLIRREDPRIPSDLACTVTAGERQKDATVYSLAASGAFLATSRASMTGARIKLEFRIDSHQIEVKAEVVYANVPGNLKRPSLPLGMGVHFIELDRANREILKSHIRARIANLEV